MNTDSNENIYDLNNIQHFYGKNKALDIKHLCIQRGTRFGLSGPNGSGKSTLLSLLGFCETPTKGNILFNGKSAHMFSINIRFKVSMLLQSSFLLKRTVAENILYGLNLRGITKNAHLQIQNALEMVGLNAQIFANRHHYQLSGGEARRVALAARLALEPEVLIMDEPTAGIDAESTVRIKEAILEISQKKQSTLIISSHDHEWLSDTCQTQLFMFKGTPFGKEKKNIIFGPFEPETADKWQKIEAGQKTITVPIPPSPHAIAMIDPQHIYLFKEKPHIESDQMMIQSQLTKLFVTPLSSVVYGSIKVGQRHMIAQIKEKSLFFPGQMVYAVYKMKDIVWHDPVQER